MALFGSVLSDEFRSDSDIDVLVSFKDDAGWGLFDFVDMIDELKAIPPSPVSAIHLQPLSPASISTTNTQRFKLPLFIYA